MLYKVLSQSVQFSYEHQINLGLFQTEQESFKLSGTLYCPFESAFHLVPTSIQKVSTEQVEWAISVGLIRDRQSDRDKLLKYDFARFAALTTVRYDIRELDTCSFKGKTLRECVNIIFRKCTSHVSDEGLLRKTKYLTFLFAHDDWAEKQTNISLLKKVHQIMLGCLRDGPGNVKILSRLEFDNLLSTEGEEVCGAPDKEYSKICGLIKACQSIGEIYPLAFYALTKGKGNVIDYNEFVDSIEQYFEGVTEEASNRKQGILPAEMNFYKKRLFTCGVYTVYLAAALESGYQIPKKITKSTREDQLRDDFSRLICHFNGLVSANREKKEKDNWSYNDLAVISYYETQRSGHPVTLEHCKDLLLGRIRTDMEDAERLLQAEFDGDIDQIIYSCIIIQWGIGSIPAQLCSKRYYEDRVENTPFIPEGLIDKIDRNFWLLLQ